MNQKEILTAIEGKSLAWIIKHLCAEKLNFGAYRDVYAIKGNNNYVVKIERDMQYGNFANVAEWRNYIDNRYYEDMNEWLCPCLCINETGQVLIQRRARIAKDWSNLPSKVPACFTDLKVQNWGWIGKRLVCVDYSFFARPALRMRTAKWWGVDEPRTKQIEAVVLNMPKKKLVSLMRGHGHSSVIRKAKKVFA